MIRFLCILLAFLPSLIFASDVYVNGYTRKDGTYVQGHYRSAPNNTVSDNFSTYGNVNPYTGKPGTVRVYDGQINTYAPSEYREESRPLKVYNLDASCKTNDGEKFSIEFNEDVLTARGKYTARRSSSQSNAWMSYSNNGYSYYLGTINNGKIPIKVTNKWGLDTRGLCFIQ